MAICAVKCLCLVFVVVYLPTFLPAFVACMLIMVAYAVTLAGLVLVNAQLFHQRYYEKKLKQDFDVELSDDDASFDSDLAEESSLSRLFRRYVAVYIFCSAADWLQVYMYITLKRRRLIRTGVVHVLFVQEPPWP